MNDRQRAAFLIGMASVLDLGGTLNRALHEEPLSPEEAARADTASMRGAWEAVGEAFRTVLGDQERAVPARPKSGRKGRLRRR